MNMKHFQLRATAVACYCIFLVAVICGCGCNSNSDSAKANWPRWTADKASIRELGEEVEVFGVKIRPPKGFEFQEPISGPAQAQIASWIQRREGAADRAVQFSVTPIPGNMDMPTAEFALGKLFERVRKSKKRDGLKQDPITMGFVNGIEFARTTWTSGTPGFDSAQEGYFYVTVSDGMIYQLATQDSQTAPESDLDICHASILSFKK